MVGWQCRREGDGKKLLFVIISFSDSHQLAYDVNRYREDNGTVLLSGNTVQRLKVSQLQWRETQLLSKEKKKKKTRMKVGRAG